jgi:hypothetical protein
MILFAIVHTAEVWNLAYQGRVWWFDCVVGLVVCGIALVRERNRLLAAVAGLSVAAATSAAAEVWHLPGEPGVATVLALTVLVASAIRTRRRGSDRLAKLISRFARRGIPVRLHVHDGLALPPQLTGPICRVVRDALTSVTKHGALATAVTVMVSRDQDTITVEVADDAPAVGARMLSATARERVESLGGSYRAGPDRGCCWLVRATMPA